MSPIDKQELAKSEVDWRVLGMSIETKEVSKEQMTQHEDVYLDIKG